MNKAITLMIVVSCIALLAAPAAAQQETPTATANASLPDGSPDSVELVITENIALVSHTQQNGQMKLRFYSDNYETVTIAPAIPSGSESGTIETSTHVLEQNAITKVEVTTPGGVSMFTDDQSIHYIRPSSSALGSGQIWGSDDLMAVGFAVSLVFTLALAWQILRARLGLGHGGERVA